MNMLRTAIFGTALTTLLCIGCRSTRPPSGAYSCPHHTEVHAAKPGKPCPFCGSEMVK